MYSPVKSCIQADNNGVHPCPSRVRNAQKLSRRPGNSSSGSPNEGMLITEPHFNTGEMHLKDCTPLVPCLGPQKVILELLQINSTSGRCHSL